MGAVHIKVKLTNAIDEALVNRGMLAPHLLPELETEALVDTGATYLLSFPALKQRGFLKSPQSNFLRLT
jgi:hypothetical protein